MNRAPDVLAARPNGRPSQSAPKTTDQEQQNKGSTRVNSKENVPLARKTSVSADPPDGSGRNNQGLFSPVARAQQSTHKAGHNHNGASSSSQRDTESPRDTKIPRPKSTNPGQSLGSPRTTPTYRKPMDLKAAFALAERQISMEDAAKAHAAQAHASNKEEDDNFGIADAFDIAATELNGGRIDGSPSPAPRANRMRQDLQGSPFRRSSEDLYENDDLAQHLRNFDKGHQLDGSNGPSARLFTSARVGPNIAKTGNTLAKKASNSSLGNSPEIRRSGPRGPGLRQQKSGETLGIRTGSGRDVPLPSIEVDVDDSALPAAGPESPEKSYGNWQLDADFTAGDLQVSDSPRIRSGTAQELAHAGLPKAARAGDSPQTSGNNRLDKLRRSEIAAANMDIPEEPPSPPRRNTRLDEIRAQEIDALSKRAVASSRLVEIRAKNSVARSTSPEDSGETKPDVEQSGTAPMVHRLDQQGAHLGAVSEMVPNSPVTIHRSLGGHDPDGPAQETKTLKASGPPEQPVHDDSQDLLRRLARATSSSPPRKQEKESRDEAHDALQKLAKATSPGPSTRELPMEKGAVPPGNMMVPADRPNRPLSFQEDRRRRRTEAKGHKDRRQATVGFTGLDRDSSSESQKRRSMATSDIDSTARFDSEMKLFAPRDDYSEKGSGQPSDSDGELEEETPRPNKVVDPLTQPTPRVTGAYVDTPVTVKTEKDEDALTERPVGKSGRMLGLLAGLHKRNSSESAVDEKTKTATKEQPGEAGTRSSSFPPHSRAARNHVRRPSPLTNSAKIPTVKNDLRDILSRHQIDDSTLEDFHQLLDDNDVDDAELEKVINDSLQEAEKPFNIPSLSEGDRELQAYERMSKTLKTGLIGIRSAKQGIERLEDQVMDMEPKKEEKPETGDSLMNIPEFPSAATRSIFPNDWIYLRIPPLFRSRSRLKPTRFGLLTMFMLIWLTLESAFCQLYVDPPFDCRASLRNIPCDWWSPNQPYFPYAMPFMIDEWTTGGQGRDMFWKASDEVGDIVAAASDWVSGHDFTKDDEVYMNVWQRKRHRRRLQKNGLSDSWTEPAQHREKFRGWIEAYKAAVSAKERVEDPNQESMGADEQVR